MKEYAAGPVSGLPGELAELRELALDLRWSWSHAADRLWERIDPELWDRTHNPWLILQTVGGRRLRRLADDADFVKLLRVLRREQRCAHDRTAWFQQAWPDARLRKIAYFSMEFGLDESLPIYSGGLGVLAADYLKAASELGLPVAGIGLLYQQGYFRQGLSADGRQLEFFPYNDPTQLPVQPVRDAEDEWLIIEVALPGRTLRLRTWQVVVGRLRLYLLDSNDPLNSPADRGITSELYGGGSEKRLQQEMVLGIGGYRLLRVLGINPEICHLNEGHAALVVLERARWYMKKEQVSFAVALTATRAGTLFTTHTPVEAGFDRFSPQLVRQYLLAYAEEGLGISFAELLALGQADGAGCAADSLFCMARLAMRGSGAVNGVSRLHGQVSRRIFQPLFPRWPTCEVPVSHVTNGVHVPSWDSPESDRIWTSSCGKQRWREELEDIEDSIMGLGDEELWDMRAANRQRFITWLRKRLQWQQSLQGSADGPRPAPETVFDPNVLTIGFARRFTSYKRTDLLLHDRERLARLLTAGERPVQLILAGKAHPLDQRGREMIEAWIRFIREFELGRKVVFLVDYDLLMAEHLVQGVDLWINTPRRPWEACGTSGMKVLVNGGLNLSELDGWWAEAWTPEVGWPLGDGGLHDDAEAWDRQEAEALYDLLEGEVLPAFYDRDVNGIPGRWVGMMRRSMATLTPRFSANRMVREYTEKYYLPMTQSVLFRQQIPGRCAAINDSMDQLRKHWRGLRFGRREVEERDGSLFFRIQVYLDDLAGDLVTVQLYADDQEGDGCEIHEMTRTEPLVGAVNGYLYTCQVRTERSVGEYTARIIPALPGLAIPLELPMILWER
jgi:starch phosphorylase